MQKPWNWTAVVLVAALILPGASGATDYLEVASTVWDDRALELGHANKIVIGRYNSLHTTYVSQGVVWYTTSANGATWSEPIILGGDFGDSAAPALAATSSGRIAAVWVENANINGLGEIYYGWRPANSNTWTISLLTESGMEPSIAASGSRVHIAWSTLDSVRYTAFTATSPPGVPINTGEVVFSSSCATSGVRQPAVALVRDPCDPPIVKVALLYTDDSDCGVGTRVGARVFERNNVSATWSQVFDGTVTGGPGGAEGVSVSMSSHFPSGNTFLAWSDENNGVARTMVARGNGATWDTATVDAERRHVHIRGNTRSWASAAGSFRLGWVGLGFGGDEFYSTDAYFRGGNWPAGGALAWSGSGPLSLGEAGRPQTLFWQRCATDSSSYLSHLIETSDGSFPIHYFLASDFLYTNLACLQPVIGGLAHADLCKSLVVGMAGMVLESGVTGTVSSVRFIHALQPARPMLTVVSAASWVSTI